MRHGLSKCSSDQICSLSGLEFPCSRESRLVDARHKKRCINLLLGVKWNQILQVELEILA
jgi:hypothetical protein